jgi:hypothetical protein
MTQFLLHGGNTKIENEENDRFFGEMTSRVSSSNPHILLCYWARPQNEWDTKAAVDTSRIKTHSQKTITADVVTSPQDLQNKLPSSDVLYVAGGDVEPIQFLVPQLVFLETALHGKLYAGSSMGTFIVSRHYISSDDMSPTPRIHTGLGLLPLNTLCHWDKETQKTKKIEQLQTTDPSVPIMTLSEFEWISIIV